MAKNYHNNTLIYKHIFSPGSDFYENYRIMVIPGKSLSTAGKIVEGMPTTPPSISLGAAYSGNINTVATLSSKFADIMHKFETTMAYIKSYVSKSSTIPSDTLVRDTISVYSNSQKPSISFEIVLFREFTPNVDQMLKNAVSYVQPDEINDCIIIPPGRYTPTTACAEGVNTKNTYSIMVGKHLLLTHFLPTSVDIEPSPQLTQGDKPMYYKVRMGFEAGRTLSMSEVQKWFK